MSLSNISGNRETVLTDRVGSTMSGIEKWLVEEKSFGITGASILLSFAIAVFLGWFYIKKISVNDEIHFMGHRYEIIGLAKQVDNGKEIFMPVYKEKS